MLNKLLAGWALTVTAFLLMGVAIPHTFVPGTTISSAEVNANFAALEAAVDALEAKTADDAPGTIRGYARVRADGTLAHSWMSDGGTPTSMMDLLGEEYFIEWPGVSADAERVIVQVMLDPGLVGEQFWSSGPFANGVQSVQVIDEVNSNFIQRGFTVILFN